VRIQLAVALIAFLLLRLAQHLQSAIQKPARFHPFGARQSQTEPQSMLNRTAVALTGYLRGNIAKRIAETARSAPTRFGDLLLMQVGLTA
jgi:hypothetical protein